MARSAAGREKQARDRRHPPQPKPPLQPSLQQVQARVSACGGAQQKTCHCRPHSGSRAKSRREQFRHPPTRQRSETRSGARQQAASSRQSRHTSLRRPGDYVRQYLPRSRACLGCRPRRRSERLAAFHPRPSTTVAVPDFGMSDPATSLGGSNPGTPLSGERCPSQQSSSGKSQQQQQ